jgi:hypothetical protein
VANSSSEAVRGAARRIEHWLLTSPVQIPDGEHAGAIVGWLDGQGRPAFVYLEITGYYLTTTAWMLAGGARSPDSLPLARSRGQSALAWLRRGLDGDGLPLTRIHLAEGGEQDWRNDAVFTFDLAMALRGASAFSEMAGDDGATGAVARDALAVGLEEVRQGQELLPSHRTLGVDQLASRWSTTRGPHHVKAAACLQLSLPVDSGLLAAAKATRLHWIEQLDSGWTIQELHPLLYGLEGMVMDGAEPLDRVQAEFERLMEAQDDSGSLPDRLCDATVQRSDVLAQALRIGALLRSAGRLEGEGWGSRLDLLADRLIEHVRPDGSVAFSHDQDKANTWCAMFAHQALVMYEAGDATTAALVRRHLV